MVALAAGIAVASRSKISSSSANARPAAGAIVAPSAPSGVVVTRTSPGGLSRWVNVAERRAPMRFSPWRRHIDEITEHVVVPDLQRADAGGFGVAHLQACDHA